MGSKDLEALIDFAKVGNPLQSTNQTLWHTHRLVIVLTC